MRSGWRTMTEGDGAPRDGSAFLAFGHHTPESVKRADQPRGLEPGDVWWAIVRWGGWWPPQLWVYAKDGATVPSEPECWQPLIGPDGETPGVAK